MFSVIIPLYNKEDTVKRAIDSVLNQTFQDFEIIVVDDGSTDQSVKQVEAINDSRLKIISQDNAGVSAARNRGIQEAGYEYLAFLDADDQWLPGFLETISHLISNYTACVVYGTRYFFGMPDEKATRPCLVRGLSDDFSGVMDDYFTIAAKSDPPIHASAVVVKKSAIDQIGGFPLGIKSGEDLLTWARLACMGPVAYSMEPKSIFWLEPAHVYAGKPSRVPDPGDRVGRELKKLLKDCAAGSSDGLKCYIALWHKMRASVYLRLNERKNCCRETLKGLVLHPTLGRLYIYLVLCLMPGRIVQKVFQSRSRNA